MTKFQRKLKIQILILSVMILTVIIGIVHTAVYMMSKSFIEKEMTLNAQAIATSVSQFISHDIEEYKKFIEKVDQYKSSRGFAQMDTADEPMPRELYENDEYFQKMQKFFAKIKIKGCDIKYIYTDRRLDDHTVEFILDSEPIGNDDHSPPGSFGEQHKERNLVFLTGESERHKLTYHEKRGYLIGSHVALYDDNDEIIGAVGVDVCGSHLFQYMNRLHFFLFLVYTFIIGITLLVMTKYSVVIMEPLFKDRLTGAYTKRYAERLIQEEIDITKDSSNLTLMVLDFDHFKNINDTYGHNFGDKVLATLAETIQRVLRHKDYFIRYGGEEFIALFPNVDKDESLDIAERIRTTVANTEIVCTEQNLAVKITISIGIAVLTHPDMRASEFIHRADKALYMAKKTRDSVVFYTQAVEKLLSNEEERQNYISSAVRRMAKE